MAYKPRPKCDRERLLREQEPYVRGVYWEPADRVFAFADFPQKVGRHAAAQRLVGHDANHIQRNAGQMLQQLALLVNLQGVAKLEEHSIFHANR